MSTICDINLQLIYLPQSIARNRLVLRQLRLRALLAILVAGAGLGLWSLLPVFGGFAFLLSNMLLSVGLLAALWLLTVLPMGMLENHRRWLDLVRLARKYDRADVFETPA